LESSKRKRKASEGVSDAEIQAASSLAQLGRKKSKKAVKKVVAAVVQRVPSAFSDDEMSDEACPTGFSFCLWCDLRFNVRHGYTPGSENKFVDVETFSDIVPEVRETPVDPVNAADAEGGSSQAPISKDKASPEFTKDLERTVRKDGDMDENPLQIENREEIPEDQDPTPSIAAYNESFGTSFRGELLSVSGEVIVADGGVPEFCLLWKSPKLMGETGGDAPKKNLQLSGKVVCGA
jgi:hypothetical protein